MFSQKSLSGREDRVGIFCWRGEPLGNENGVLLLLLLLFILFVCFLLFSAAPIAYEDSQPRGLIGATAASLGHKHSNARSELSLLATLQLMATPDP